MVPPSLQQRRPVPGPIHLAPGPPRSKGLDAFSEAIVAKLDDLMATAAAESEEEEVPAPEVAQAEPGLDVSGELVEMFG
jgi:hypothetical protein